MSTESKSPKVVYLTSVKLDGFLKALTTLSRDEYRPHLANIIYDDYQQNASANQHAKATLSARH